MKTLMEAPKTLASALEMLGTLTAENERLKADAEAFTALSAEHTALIQERDSLAEKITATSADNATLAASIEALKAEQATLEERANAKAIEAIAASGVPPVAVAHSPIANKSKQDLWNEFNALPIEARNDFYQRNRAAMRG